MPAHKKGWVASKNKSQKGVTSKKGKIHTCNVEIVIMLGRRRGGRWVQKFTAQGCVASLSKQTSKRETRDKIATYDWTRESEKGNV